jgi:hypothetical protein
MENKKECDKNVKKRKVSTISVSPSTLDKLEGLKHKYKLKSNEKTILFLIKNMRKTKLKK